MINIHDRNLCCAGCQAVRWLWRHGGSSATTSPCGGSSSSAAMSHAATLPPPPLPPMTSSQPPPQLGSDSLALNKILKKTDDMDNRIMTVMKKSSSESESGRHSTSS